MVNQFFLDSSDLLDIWILPLLLNHLDPTLLLHKGSNDLHHIR